MSVPVIDDAQDDGNAIDFSLAVTNVVTGAVGEPGHAVIVDNDGPPPIALNVGANIGDSSIVEGDERHSFGVVERALGSASRLSQPHSRIKPSMEPPRRGARTTRRKRARLPGNPGQTTRTININILPDTTNEGDEEFYVDLTSVGGGHPLGDTRGVITILDDDNPTASNYVVSVGDAQMYEGNADLGVVDLPITVNSKRPKDAPDEDISIQVDILPDIAPNVTPGDVSDTDIFEKKLTSTLTFAGSVNKNIQITVRGDTAVEGDERLRGRRISIAEYARE